MAISQHLLTSAPQLKGGAVQLGLDETLRRITQDGDGYCADFVRVFTAIATAAGMPVRSWAFSFDGFGGHGHVLPEIWNRQRKVWQALDLFDNVYFVSADGLPLSALALRTWLTQRPDTPQVLPLAPAARPGYAIESKLWDYYRAGLNEWYLWWGNNPFSYEQAAPVRWLSPVSRSLAQLGAVALGGSAAAARHCRRQRTKRSARRCGVASMASAGRRLRGAGLRAGLGRSDLAPGRRTPAAETGDLT